MTELSAAPNDERLCFNENWVHYESLDSNKKLEASQVDNLAKKAALLIARSEVE